MGEYQKILNNASGRVFNAPYLMVANEILKGEPLPERDLGDVKNQLSDLLGIGQLQTSQLLGFSPSRASRNKVVSTEILDRGAESVRVFARVSTIMGENSARAWLKHPNKALNNRAPIDVLGTRVGVNQIEEMLTALEDGTYL